MALSEENPVYGPFFGVMGAAAAIIFSGTYFIDSNESLRWQREGSIRSASVSQ